ncbi:MAG: TonB family protein [Chitinivibrionales bacterium]|nr:TonB family protein [Chitinivibrionales bacterium]
MTKRTIMPLIALAALFVLLCLAGCGKQKPKVYVAIIDSDTLTLANCKRFAPDSTLNETQVYALVREMLLARLDTGATDPAVMKELANQLSLQSGQQWSAPAAQMLYKATCQLQARLRRDRSAGLTAKNIDSLMGKRVVMAKEYPRAVLAGSLDTLWKKAIDPKKLPGLLPAYCQSLFALKPAVAAWIASFISSEEETAPAAGKNNIKKMVAGLIFDSAAATKASVAAPPPAPLNNKEIIKYRSRKSIADSIGSRSAELEGIYKMHLKLSPQLAGTVWITFRIRPDGTVSEAALRSSQIGDRKFLEALQAYAQTMRFKPVQAKLGDMSFEFPFNFTPEQ